MVGSSSCAKAKGVRRQRARRIFFMRDFSVCGFSPFKKGTRYLKGISHDWSMKNEMTREKFLTSLRRRGSR